MPLNICNTSPLDPQRPEDTHHNLIPLTAPLDSAICLQMPQINAVYGPGFILSDAGQDMLLNTGIDSLTNVQNANTAAVFTGMAGTGESVISPTAESESACSRIEKSADNGMIYLHTGSDMIILTLAENIIPSITPPNEDAGLTAMSESLAIASSTQYFYSNSSVFQDLDIGKIITDIIHY